MVNIITLSILVAFHYRHVFFGFFRRSWARYPGQCHYWSMIFPLKSLFSSRIFQYFPIVSYDFPMILWSFHAPKRACPTKTSIFRDLPLPPLGMNRRSFSSSETPRRGRRRSSEIANLRPPPKDSRPDRAASRWVGLRPNGYNGYKMVIFGRSGWLMMMMVMMMIIIIIIIIIMIRLRRMNTVTTIKITSDFLRNLKSDRSDPEVDGFSLLFQYITITHSEVVWGGYPLEN